VRFVGVSHEVARLGGVNVKRMRFSAYVLSAFICGIGGILLAASIGGNDPEATSLYLLPAFAAVFLGSVIGRHAQYNALGTLAAIYFLVTGIVGLQLFGLVGWIESAFYGAALVAAVSVSHFVRRAAR
jgi:ribose transport system permease protein